MGGGIILKTWISFILPADEYKEKRLLYFISEGSIIELIYFLVMIVCSRYFNLTTVDVLLGAIALFLFYVYGRYIISGIEYTDISTEKSYRMELKVILIRTTTFVGVFVLTSFVFIELLGNGERWFNAIGLLLGMSIVMFISNFISLNRSYKKNKDLL